MTFKDTSLSFTNPPPSPQMGLYYTRVAVGNFKVLDGFAIDGSLDRAFLEETASCVRGRLPGPAALFQIRGARRAQMAALLTGTMTEFDVCSSGVEVDG